jgi:integrase
VELEFPPLVRDCFHAAAAFRVQQNSVPPISTMVLLAFRHGLRASELVDLRWDDLENAILHVRRVKQGTPATHPLTGRELRALRRRDRRLRCRLMTGTPNKGRPPRTENRMASRPMKMPAKHDGDKSPEADDVFSQRKRPELGRYLLQVDRQTKGSYTTSNAAQSAALGIKTSHPVTRESGPAQYW